MRCHARLRSSLCGARFKRDSGSIFKPTTTAFARVHREPGARVDEEGDLPLTVSSRRSTRRYAPIVPRERNVVKRLSGSGGQRIRLMAPTYSCQSH